jgi:hypothetical protein
MFASNVVKSKTKSAASSMSNLAQQNATLAASRIGRGAVGQPDVDRSPVGNQGMLRLLAQRNPNPGVVQRKLVVGQSNDPLEHEADRVADQVMRMPDPELSIAPALPRVSRKCATCEDEEAQKLQKKNDGHSEISGEAPPLVHAVLSSPGQPLDRSDRAFMEARFGRDFSRVRVHTDAQAAESARAVDALAYTIGQDLVFDHGQYGPGTLNGKKLLAHELTHVSQQLETPRRGGVVQRQPGGSGSGPSSTPASATGFHPGVDHGHTPSGRWSDVKANPNSDFWANRVCANFTPNEVVEIAKKMEFSDKPIALEHLNWYLRNGGGADFVEDKYLALMLFIDTDIQNLLHGRIPSRAPSGGKFSGHLEVQQGDYHYRDFLYAFGAIDILDFEVYYTEGVVYVWFQDRYEWHPLYPRLYSVKSGDVWRPTNCVHAALVELKTRGAADFWMKGVAKVPLSVVRSAVGASTIGEL